MTEITSRIVVNEGGHVRSGADQCLDEVAADKAGCSRHYDPSALPVHVSFSPMIELDRRCGRTACAIVSKRLTLLEWYRSVENSTGSSL
jgi:hypothetical protein